MTFREALEKSDRNKLIELVMDHYDPKHPNDFQEAVGVMIERLLEIDISNLPEKEKLNGVLLVCDEVGTEYDLDKGFSKWEQIICSYYDYDKAMTMSIEFSPFRMWLPLPIARYTLDHFPLEVVTMTILTDMLFYTNIYDAADSSKPLDGDTQDAFKEVVSRLEDIESGMVCLSNANLTEGQSALPGAEEAKKSPETLVHDIMEIIYPGLPDDIYDAMEKMTMFTAMRDASYSTRSYNQAVVKEPSELFAPSAEVIEAYDKLEAYRLATGRTKEITKLLEML